VGSSTVPDIRKVPPVWGSYDDGQSFCSAESMHHDAGKVWCAVPVLFQTAESSTDHQVFEGGTEVTTTFEKSLLMTLEEIVAALEGIRKELEDRNDNDESADNQE